MIFGNHIRQLREESNLVLREVAAKLEIDTATMSKIELGLRFARRKHIPLLAKLFNCSEEVLQKKWLADKIYQLLEDEKLGYEALKVAEQVLEYDKTKTDKN